MANSTLENCPKCSRIFTGAIETSSATVGGIQFVVMRETSDRNWIACDGCNQIVCKHCCIMPDSGYCDGCFFKYKIEPHVP